MGKNLYIKNNEEEKPVAIRIRHSISKKYSQEKMKAKLKEKDSIQSCKVFKNIIGHNLENEKFKKIKKEEDIKKAKEKGKEKEKEKEKNKEKNKEKYKEKDKDKEIVKENWKLKENIMDRIAYQNKSNKNIAVNHLCNHTPTSKKAVKMAYNSNRNITKITINPKTVENKDIHLVFEGKQETIINYTNQEMVKDENEYMVECLKVLLKLKTEEQPRCKQKVNFNFPKEEKNKKIALFDLDETLVHCTKGSKGMNGDSVNVKLPTNKTVAVGLNIRSHWKEALNLIKSQYHIVIYTASHQSYADAVLNYLDKENKYFQYRLYRNHCVQCDVDGMKFYVKDLDTLNKYYNLKDVVLIDNSVLSFAYHLNNGIPIVPFIEQKDDTQLLMLAYYLVSIASFDDLTQENKKHINIEHYVSLARKLAEEEFEEEEEDEEKTQNNEEDNKSNIIIIQADNNNNSTNEIKNDNDLSGKKSDESKDKSNIENKKSFLVLKKSTKLLMKKSEKALKIAEDMKKSLGEVYKNKI